MSGRPAAALDRDVVRRVQEAAHAEREAVIAFCRDLVRIPSPSGDERDAAQRTAEQMRAVGLDEVWQDGAGNVLGLLRADAADRVEGAVLFDAHLDHVDAGSVAAWTRPPFEGHVEGGRLFGRGATDTKSSVAAQVHGVGLLRRACREAGVLRRRDVVVAAVVQEEVGGLGTSFLLESGLRPAAAVIGEPSLCGLSFGHRGRIEVEVCFEGRAAHASRPEWGLNPHGSLARFVTSLEACPHDTDARFGRSTVAPTLVHASPASPNVIPSELRLTLDWRNVASETPQAVRERVEVLATRATEPGVKAAVRTPTRCLASYTGLSRDIERVSRPFATDPDGAFMARARHAVEAALGRDVPVIAWDFASDGGWLAAAGTPCVGFGPGEMRVMHAVDESVDLNLLCDAVAGNALLALALGECDRDDFDAGRAVAS